MRFITPKFLFHLELLLLIFNLLTISTAPTNCGLLDPSCPACLLAGCKFIEELNGNRHCVTQDTEIKGINMVSKLTSPSQQKDCPDDEPPSTTPPGPTVQTMWTHRSQIMDEAMNAASTSNYTVIILVCVMLFFALASFGLLLIRQKVPNNSHLSSCVNAAQHGSLRCLNFFSERLNRFLANHQVTPNEEQPRPSARNRPSTNVNIPPDVPPAVNIIRPPSASPSSSIFYPPTDLPRYLLPLINSERKPVHELLKDKKRKTIKFTTEQIREAINNMPPLFHHEMEHSRSSTHNEHKRVANSPNLLDLPIPNIVEEDTLFGRNKLPTPKSTAQPKPKNLLSAFANKKIRNAFSPPEYIPMVDMPPVRPPPPSMPQSDDDEGHSSHQRSLQSERSPPEASSSAHLSTVTQSSSRARVPTPAATRSRRAPNLHRYRHRVIHSSSSSEDGEVPSVPPPPPPPPPPPSQEPVPSSESDTDDNSTLQNFSFEIPLEQLTHSNPQERLTNQLLPCEECMNDTCPMRSCPTECTLCKILQKENRGLMMRCICICANGPLLCKVYISFRKI